jgi:hypothetical protein
MMIYGVWMNFIPHFKTENMKKLYTLILSVFLSATLWAQAPQKMSYQAVIRGANNALVIDKPVGVRVSILQGSETGSTVYSETHTPTTNSNGLTSLSIGVGKNPSSDFSKIDWSKGPYFVKTETDVEGGTNYQLTSVSELMSVPYALYAANSQPGPKGDNGQNTLVKTSIEFAGANCTNGGVRLEYGLDANNNGTLDVAEINSALTKYVCNGIKGSTSNDNNFFLGKDTLGGIVFYVYKGSKGEQKGLIVSKIETLAQWQSSNSITGATSMWDGKTNTNLMTNSPAKNWVSNNFTSEWYIPSINELQILFQNIYHVNKAIKETGYTTLPFGQEANTDYFWSSTEKIDEARYSYDENNAYTFGIPQGYNYILGDAKSSIRKVRAIRSF